MSRRPRNIPDAKFEFGTFYIFEDMTHKLPSQKGNKSLNLNIYLLEMGSAFFKK